MAKKRPVKKRRREQADEEEQAVSSSKSSNKESASKKTKKTKKDDAKTKDDQVSTADKVTEGEDPSSTRRRSSRVPVKVDAYEPEVSAPTTISSTNKKRSSIKPGVKTEWTNHENLRILTRIVPKDQEHTLINQIKKEYADVLVCDEPLEEDREQGVLLPTVKANQAFEERFLELLVFSKAYGHVRNEKLFYVLAGPSSESRQQQIRSIYPHFLHLRSHSPERDLLYLPIPLF